jgi:hypothetical protein
MALRRSAFAAFIGILLTAGAVFAHHSLVSEFQMGTPTALKGVLTKVEWDNPHVYWDVDVKDQSGNVVHWSIEGLPPSYLHRSGVTREQLLKLVGTTLTVHGRLAKDGSKLMWALDFQLPDGSIVPVGPRAGDAGAQ